MKRRALVLGGAAALAGCGGGGSRVSFKPGRAVFTIEWPKSTTRLIPAASNSIVVEVRQNGELLDRRVVRRSDTMLTFDNLPEGDLTALATAYPTTDGTGVAHASGIVALTIRDGETTQVPLTMSSTIASFALSIVTLGVGETRRVLATPRDVNGAILLIPATQLRTEIIDGTGNIVWDALWLNATGSAAGMVTFRLTDLESGISGTATLEVGPVAPPRPNPVVSSTIFGIDGLCVDTKNYVLWYSRIDPKDQFLVNYQILGVDPDTGIEIHRFLSKDTRSLIMSNDNDAIYITSANIIQKYTPRTRQLINTYTGSLWPVEFSGITPDPDSLLLCRLGQSTNFVVNRGVRLPNTIYIASSSLVLSKEQDRVYCYIDSLKGMTISTIDPVSGFKRQFFADISDFITYAADNIAYSSYEYYDGTNLTRLGVFNRNFPPAEKWAFSATENKTYSISFPNFDPNQKVFITSCTGVPLQPIQTYVCPWSPGGRSEYPRYFLALGQNRVVIATIRQNAPLYNYRIIVCNGS
jgi:hypothetical protein